MFRILSVRLCTTAHTTSERVSQFKMDLCPPLFVCTCVRTCLYIFVLNMLLCFSFFRCKWLQLCHTVASMGERGVNFLLLDSLEKRIKMDNTRGFVQDANPYLVVCKFIVFGTHRDWFKLMVLFLYFQFPMG